MKFVFNNHPDITGRHAILSPSGYTWVNHVNDEDPGDIISRYISSFATDIGTATHEYAQKQIKYQKYLNEYCSDCFIVYLLERGFKEKVIDIQYIYPNLINYVNDAIDLKMNPEVPLKYSDFAFGTADAISFEKKLLRISDLKTGKTPVHIEQLLCYAALFCLEYKKDPKDFNTELRIYQGGDVIYHEPHPDEIGFFINKYIEGTKILTQYFK